MDIFNILTSSDDYDSLTLNRHLCNYLDKAITCLQMVTPTTPAPQNQSGFCPQMWSVVNCYPRTPFNRTVAAPCASNFGTTAKVGDGASPKGIIAMHCNETTEGWNERSSVHTCYSFTAPTDNVMFENVTLPPDYASDLSDDYYASAPLSTAEVDAMNKRYEILTRYVTVGHALSVLSLIIALTLLASLKHIHCTRIYIHMNLMVAFMLRGLLWILHMAAFQDPELIEDKADTGIIELSAHVFQRHFVDDLPKLQEWKGLYCIDLKQESDYVWCRLYYAFLNYSVTANYFWLLVEGLYLRLLLRAVVFSHKKYMKSFLVLGWAFPWLPVLGSVLAKSLDPNENKDCWFEDANSAYWWIIKVPILVSLLINFIIFVNVVHVVGSKLRVSQRNRTEDTREDYKWRLAKSTLSLIPLLGIQYIVTAFVQIDSSPQNPTAEFVKKALEVSFVSVQGLLVAFIYCFFNGEVQEECGKTWRRWKTRWELNRREREHIRLKRRKSTNTSSITNLYTATREFSLYTDFPANDGNGHTSRLNSYIPPEQNTPPKPLFQRPPKEEDEQGLLPNDKTPHRVKFDSAETAETAGMKETDIIDTNQPNNCESTEQDTRNTKDRFRQANGKIPNRNRDSSIV